MVSEAEKARVMRMAPAELEGYFGGMPPAWYFEEQQRMLQPPAPTITIKPPTEPTPEPPTVTIDISKLPKTPTYEPSGFIMPTTAAELEQIYGGMPPEPVLKIQEEEVELFRRTEEIKKDPEFIEARPSTVPEDVWVSYAAGHPEMDPEDLIKKWGFGTKVMEAKPEGVTTKEWEQFVSNQYLSSEHLGIITGPPEFAKGPIELSASWDLQQSMRKLRDDEKVLKDLENTATTTGTKEDWDACTKFYNETYMPSFEKVNILQRGIEAGVITGTEEIGYTLSRPLGDYTEEEYRSYIAPVFGISERQWRQAIKAKKEITEIEASWETPSAGELLSGLFTGETWGRLVTMWGKPEETELEYQAKKDFEDVNRNLETILKNNPNLKRDLEHLDKLTEKLKTRKNVLVPGKNITYEEEYDNTLARVTAHPSFYAYQAFAEKGQQVWKRLEYYKEYFGWPREVAKMAGVFLSTAGIGTVVGAGLKLGITGLGVAAKAAPSMASIAAKSPTAAWLLSGAGKVGTTAIAHPTITKGLLWAPFVGPPAYETGKMVYEGKSVTEILEATGPTWATLAGFYVGATIGFERGPLAIERVGIGEKPIWTGLTFRGKPVIGKTPEGWAVGVPKLSQTIIDKYYLPIVQSYDKYAPMGRAETRIFEKNFFRGLSTTDKELITKGLRLTAETSGRNAPKIIKSVNDLPFEKLKARHPGLTDKGIRAIRDIIRSEDKIVVFGSVPTEAQMKAGLGRGLGDVDAQVVDPAAFARKVANAINKAEGRTIATVRGNMVRGPTGAHLVDVHGFEPTGGYSLSSLLGGKKYIAYGFEEPPKIPVGKKYPWSKPEFKTFTIGEQIIRKGPMSSLRIGAGGVGPVSHRTKDILDWIRLLSEQARGPTEIAYLKDIVRLFRSKGYEIPESLITAAGGGAITPAWTAYVYGAPSVPSAEFLSAGSLLGVSYLPSEIPSAVPSAPSVSGSILGESYTLPLAFPSVPPSVPPSVIPRVSTSGSILGVSYVRPSYIPVSEVVYPPSKPPVTVHKVPYVPPSKPPYKPLERPYVPPSITSIIYPPSAPPSVPPSIPPPVPPPSYIPPLKSMTYSILYGEPTYPYYAPPSKPSPPYKYPYPPYKPPMKPAPPYWPGGRREKPRDKRRIEKGRVYRERYFDVRNFLWGDGRPTKSASEILGETRTFEFGGGKAPGKRKAKEKRRAPPKQARASPTVSEMLGGR